MLIKVLIGTCLSSMILMSADAQYIKSGKVVFERKIYLRKQSEESSFQERLIRENINLKVDLFDLHFGNGRSVYTLNVVDPMSSFFIVPGLHNMVFNDFKNQARITIKDIFGQVFTVVDRGPKMKWKYTGEIREIAGYNCKRAESIIFDSLYVIAFYSETISAPTGPESFGGLPGIILGLAIPALNTTWFAKEVDILRFEGDKFKWPDGNDGITPEHLRILLEESRFSWGTNSGRYFIWSII